MSEHPHGPWGEINYDPGHPGPDELPGMWEHADLSGGWADSEDEPRCPGCGRRNCPRKSSWQAFECDGEGDSAPQ